MERIQKDAKLNMHKMFLEALRHREQDIVRFLVILGPALGGFIWLLGADMQPAQFIGGTYGVLLTLVLGAFYALALGYNYRYLTLQLAKLESAGHIDLKGTVLTSWPRMPEEFIQRNRWGVIPWCTPPGIIKVFWVAFLVGILGVTTVASVVVLDPAKAKQASATQPSPKAGPVSTDVPKQYTLDLRGQCRLRRGPAASACIGNPRGCLLRRPCGPRPHRRLDPASQSFIALDTQTLARLKNAIPFVGSGAFLAAWLLGPFSVGRKMLRASREEDLDDWKKQASGGQPAQEGEQDGEHDGT